MSVPKSWRTLEIMQQCRFGFTKEYVAELCKNWSVIKDYAYIEHNCDLNEDGTTVESHIHLMLRFNCAVPTSAILNKLDGVCEVQHLQRMKSWNAAMAYLCHDNKPDKHQYEHCNVVSNFDWEADAEKGLSGSKRLDLIISQIDAGICKRYNITDYVTVQEYTRWKTKIDNAFFYRDVKLLNEVNRVMDVVYIWGDSGTGKTTYAKRCAEDRNLSMFISSGGSDFLDGYNGQECIILDDFRGSSVPLNVILKLLDNNTCSSVPSRYRNKSISECKLIIITTILPMEKMFSDVFELNSEPLDQFKRRCRLVMHFTLDNIVTSLYNSNLGEYEKISVTPNIVLDSIRKNFAVEDKKEYLMRVLGGASDMFKGIAEAIERDDIPF